VDEVEAAKGMFGGRIAHRLLSAGFIGTVLAMQLPRPGTIYLSPNLRLVRIGDTVTARVEVAEVIAPSAACASPPPSLSPRRNRDRRRSDRDGARGANRLRIEE